MLLLMNSCGENSHEVVALGRLYGKASELNLSQRTRVSMVCKNPASTEG